MKLCVLFTLLLTIEVAGATPQRSCTPLSEAYFKELSKEFESRLIKSYPNAKYRRLNPARSAYRQLKKGNKPTSELIEKLLGFGGFPYYKKVSLKEVIGFLEMLDKVLSTNQGRTAAKNLSISIHNLFHRRSFAIWHDLVPVKLIESIIVKGERADPVGVILAKDLKGPIGSSYQYGHPYVTSMSLLLNILPKDSPAFNAIGPRIGLSRSALRLTKYFDALPLPIQAALSSEWLTTAGTPPKTIKKIRIVEKKDEQLVKYCGSCPLMKRGHETSLEHFSLTGDSFYNSLITVGNVLVGSIKWEGDPSILALNNITNKEGQLVIAAGMTYHPSKELLKQLKRIKVNRLPSDFELILSPNFAIRKSGGVGFRELVLKLQDFASKGRKLSPR